MLKRRTSRIGTTATANEDPYWCGSREATLDEYWPSFMGYCHQRLGFGHEPAPTEDGFWKWYISEEGPLGIHLKGHFFLKTMRVRT